MLFPQCVEELKYSNQSTICYCVHIVNNQVDMDFQ